MNIGTLHGFKCPHCHSTETGVQGVLFDQVRVKCFGCERLFFVSVMEVCKTEMEVDHV